MAKDFDDVNGTAIKGPELYKYKDDENAVRLFGKILPRYVYWLKGANGKQVPIECLAFDRDKEAFTNVEKDLVREMYPEMKCQWAYAINCIDMSDGKVKVLNLKKKLFLQIVETAKETGLGKPTDPDTGWDVIFKKKKTGTSVFNVEYTLSLLKLKQRPLTAEERALVEASPTIDEKLPRPTVDDVRASLERIMSGGSESSTDSAEAESMRDLL